MVTVHTGTLGFKPQAESSFGSGSVPFDAPGPVISPVLHGKNVCILATILYIHKMLFKRRIYNHTFRPN